MSSQSQGSKRKSRESELAGIEAAMRRAAEVARRRAIETSGWVAVYIDGKIVHHKTGAGTSE